MKFVIVDTDAFSHLSFNTAATESLGSHLAAAVPVISFTTVAEVHFGAAKAGWGQRRVDRLEEAIRRYVVAPFDQDLARLWGRLKHQAQQAGHPLGHNSQTNDLWICATAIYHNAPLLTLNRRHFENFPGLVLLT
ncbi:type II toxin-antitoxin system VapC family toxin [Actinoplanes oblitus]|uniref:Ribonuclease VapC n=1 Tax=Actinoplanes oblitus TaxID=3040509 RepID=A0ABY8WCL9_9ACTN|nr:type II toxin-antitoxin system VapC family toxin [Actinoplanes oblitus]WIM94154.1 type II toxin-antitoxin system VapC family toxin [Actinoplanes oblitus]